MAASYLGVRVCRVGESYKIGDKARRSYDWSADDGETLLPGTSTISLGSYHYDTPQELTARIRDAIAGHDYGKGDVVIIAGNDEIQGEDAGESIIISGVVIGIL